MEKPSILNLTSHSSSVLSSCQLSQLEVTGGSAGAGGIESAAANGSLDVAPRFSGEALGVNEECVAMRIEDSGCLY
jgi:hypothetical protein